MAGRRKRIVGKFQRQKGTAGSARPKTPLITTIKPQTPSPAQAIKEEQELEQPATTEQENQNPETFADNDIAPEFAQANEPESQEVDPLPKDNDKTKDKNVAKAEKNASASDGQSSEGMSDDEESFVTEELERQAKRKFEGRENRSRRRKIGITIAVALTSVSIFGTVALLPTLIVKQVTSKLSEAFMDRVNYAMEARVEKYIEKYAQNVILPMKACGTKVSSSCVNVPVGTGMLSKLYTSWREGKVEDKLLKKYGLSFEYDAKKPNEIKLFRANAAGIQEEVGTFGRNSFTKEVSSVMKESLTEESRFFGVRDRRQMRALAESKYNSKKWCIIACRKKDELTDIRLSAIKRLKLKLINRVVAPFSSKGAAYLLCFVADCTPDAIIREGEKAAREVAERVGSETLEDISKKVGEKSISQYVAEQIAATVLRVAFQYEADAAASAAASGVPVAGQIYLGLTLFDMVDQFDKKIEGGAVTRYIKNIREQAYMDYGTGLLSATDDVVSFEANLADAGAVAQTFYGFNSSRVWQSVNNVSPKSTVQCKDEVLSGEDAALACPEQNVNPGTRVEEWWAKTKMIIPNLDFNLKLYNFCFSQIPFTDICVLNGRLQTIVHNALRAVNWAIGGIISAILGFVSSIPFVGDTLDKAMDAVNSAAMWIFNAISDRVFKLPIDPDASGGQAATQFAGFYDVMSNQYAEGYKDSETGEFIGLGGSAITPQQQASLSKAIAAKKLEEKKRMGIFERYFAFSNTDSITATTVAQIGGSLPADGDSIALPSVNLAFIDTLSSLFGISKKSSAAFENLDRQAIFGVRQMGFAVDDQALNIDPEELTDEKCQEFEQLRNDSATIDPETGETIYTVTNPCALDAAVVDALTKAFDPDPPGTGTAAGTGGDTLSGGLIAGTPLPGGDTTGTPCPQTATAGFLRVEPEAYINGQRYTINLCSVHGVQINSVVATAYDNLFTAMKAAGYTFNGTYGFRDMASQVRGYAGGAGADTFARPGYSNHQYGAAVDISCQGGGQNYTAGTGRGRTSFLSGVSAYSCLQWVANNSSKYGLLLQCVGQGSDGGEIKADSGGCEWWHLSPTGG